MANLLDPQTPSTGAVSGRLAEGTVTAADLVGPLEAGNASTTIHTDDLPGGEVRGQVR